MGILEALVTIVGVFGILGFLLILFCRYLPGWTWIRSYIFSSTREEKMTLTKPGHYNPDGCMIPSSDSELNLSGRGSFRRFDKTDTDYLLLRQGSVNSIRQSGGIPPQPLRPAPIPPYVIGSLQSQGSLDSVFATAPSSPFITATAAASISEGPIIPLTQGNQQPLPPPSTTGSPRNSSSGDGGGGGGGGLSNNNPFLPLIQASTQFFSQKFQSFQPQNHQNGSNNGSSASSSSRKNASGTSSSSSSSSSPAPPLIPGPVRNANNSQSKSSRSSFPSTTDNDESESIASYSTRNSSFPTTLPNSSGSGGLSMGEILFSSPPAYSIPPPPVDSSPLVPPPPAPEDETRKAEKLVSMDANQKNSFVGSKEVSRTEKKDTCKLSGDENNGRKDEEEERGSGIRSEAKCVTSNSSSLAADTREMTQVPHKPSSPSPTRLRDRQRKMEFTLQHLQNNQEDRLNAKKHSNVDACYPVGPSASLIAPKSGESTGSGSVSGEGGGGGGAGGGGRFRSPKHHGHHLQTVPTLPEEAEETGTEATSSSSWQGDSMLTMNEMKERLEEMRSKSILESMREEIRLENERMADATKSLMMEDHFSGEKGGSKDDNGGGGGANNGALNITTPPAHFSSAFKNHSFEKQNSAESQNGKFQRVPSADGTGGGAAAGTRDENSRKVISQPLRFTKGDANSNFTMSSNLNRSLSSGQQNRPVGFGNANNGEELLSFHSRSLDGPSGSSGGIMSTARNSSPPVVVPFKNTRSFSLRQSSTDSVGSEGSDVGSPDGLGGGGGSGGGLPSLQRAMSCDSVCSDTSVILGDFEPPHVTGHLLIGLEYDSETADLLVNVIEAKELVGPDPCSKTPFDSYVRVYLLPDKTTNMQTRVYRKSVNPVYKEKFMFGLETMELPLRTLVFYLYGTDKHSNTLIGEAELKLGDLDILQPTTTWLQLTDTGQKGGESGEMMFSLSYLPTAERLTVVVVKGRNLKFPHEKETGDPFVKVYLLQKGKKVSKKKSTTKRAEKNPIFNEAMIFSVPAHALQTIQLRITVADSSETEGRAYSIGHVIVGSSTTGKSLSHWNQMLSSLRKPIAMWHPLRK